MKTIEWNELDARHPIAKRRNSLFFDPNDEDLWEDVDNLFDNTDENIDTTTYLKHILIKRWIFSNNVF